MKKEKKVWALTLLAFWLLSPNFIKAQQDSTHTLDEVIITGTRLEQPIIEVPRSVTVISRQAIERSVYTSVGELLNREAGIYLVGATQTPGTNQSIFLRGANSNQVAILIDGLRITDPSSPNGTIDMSELSLIDVERIEIIRGSHSTLYGGAAIGGAINIVTRKSTTNGFHGSASVQSGTFGDGSLTLGSDVNVNYRNKNGWFVHGGAHNEFVNGFNATIDTIHTEGVYRTTDADDFRKNDFYLKTGVQRNLWEISVSAKRVSQNAEIDDRAFDDDDNAFLDFNRNLLEYNAGLKISDRWRVAATGSWSASERLLKNDSSIADFDSRYDKTYIRNAYNGTTMVNELIAHFTEGNIQALGGVGQYRDNMDFSTYYFSNAFGFPFSSEVNYDSIDTSSRSEYAFAQLSYELRKLRLKAGTRYTSHSTAGNFWTFEFNPSYTLDNLLFYGSLSTGFNAPSLYQLYDPTSGSGTTITRGNRKLKPEKSLSLEVGVKKEYHNGSYVTLSAFHSATKDNIEYVYLWDKNADLGDLSFQHYLSDLYINISRQVVNGIELSGHAVLGKFYIHGNVSRMAGKISVDPADIPLDETEGHHVQLYNYGPFVTEKITVHSLARRPSFTGLLEVGFSPVRQITLTTTYRHTGARNDVEYDAALGPFGALAEKKVQRYNLMDLGASYAPNKKFVFSFKAENILEEEYFEINGFRSRGRSFYLKASFRW